MYFIKLVLCFCDIYTCCCEYMIILSVSFSYISSVKYIQSVSICFVSICFLSICFVSICFVRLNYLDQSSLDIGILYHP